MTLRLLRPAPLLPLADMLGREGPLVVSPQMIARAQAGSGKSWGFARADGLTVACAGLMPSGEAWEAWFAALPEAAPHMRSFVRLAQLTLACASEDRSVVTRAETKAGERLARALGFRPTSAPALWRWERR